MDSEREILQIDLKKVVAERAPKVYRFIPDFVIGWVEKLICQDRMNGLLKANYHLDGVDFSHGILDYLNIRCRVDGLDNLPTGREVDSWRVIFVSNHPLGGLDGMALIDLIGSRAPQKRMRFIVNDLLMNIPPLQSVFLPVNTISGKQSRQGAQAIDTTFAGDEPVAIFPAGLCSRLIKGRVCDLEWNKMFVNKAIHYKRDIIPIHFNGQNSGFFYNFAKLRKMLRIPVNLEMSLLPREVFRNENAEFVITIGERISWETLAGGSQAKATASRLRNQIYSLPKA